MKSKPIITFFTGSGLSHAAGIPTFRSEGGLWLSYDPEEVCSLRGYNRNKEKVLHFHNLLRQEMEKCRPTFTHRVIAGLEQYFDVTVVTQNIDNLHEQAGSTKLIKVHGDLFRAKLKRYKEPTIPWNKDIELASYPIGSETSKGTMRHDVVLFGEQPYGLKKASKIISESEILITIGTSLVVFPAASLVLESKGVARYYLDPHPNEELLRKFSIVIRKRADDGIIEVLKDLEERFGFDLSDLLKS